MFFRGLVKEPNWSLRQGEKGEEVRVAVRSRIRVYNPGMQVRQASRGFGIVCLADVWLSQERELGSLVLVLPQWRSASVPVHALTTARAVPARVRLFLELLVEKLEDERRLRTELALFRRVAHAERERVAEMAEL